MSEYKGMTERHVEMQRLIDHEAKWNELFERHRISFNKTLRSLGKRERPWREVDNRSE